MQTKTKTTKADKIRSAIKANPNAKATEIAKALGVNPQEIYMLRYKDRKRLQLTKVRTYKRRVPRHPEKTQVIHSHERGMRKSLKPKADGDYENFMNLSKQMPTFEQVMPQVTMAEIKQIRKKIDDMEHMHPLAVIAVSVVISVLIVIPFTL
jgi:hypothetical protein